MEESSITLKLVQQAKSAGGDKYQVYPATKESFFYIPQNISRADGVSARESLTLTLTLTLTPNEETGAIEFVLVKHGKTGDDRYTSVDQTAWKGDIYLPHKYRNAENKLFVKIV